MSTQDQKDRWYGEGLCFSCTGCGHCCRIEGYVWVTREEIGPIASTLGLDVDTFTRRFLRRVGNRYSLVEKANHHCIFWEDGCTVYAVRPRQCRTFPFWPENLRSRRAWENTTDECPGAGTGRRHTQEEIDSLRDGRGETLGT